MVFPRCISIAFLLMIASSMIMSGDAVPGKDVGKGDFANINSKLKALRKPAVKTIRSSDGDLIDCVEINKQPAFDHPNLKNHAIQMRPSFMQVQNLRDDKKNSSSSGVPLQTWQRSGHCPKGTIPILRVRKQDLLRWGNLESFGRKNSPVYGVSNERQEYANRTLTVNDIPAILDSQPNPSVSLLSSSVLNHFGSEGTITIWNPKIEADDDYSTSQLWLIGGGENDYESVECGWIVNPKLNGDVRTRIFAYWTVDASHETGCFNLLCPGFVQVSSAVAFGSAINDISTLGGDMKEATFQITRDDKTGNWWVNLGGENVGYWPSELFTSYLKSGATLAQWGGEVSSPNVKKTPHTATAMGSGEYAESLILYASYVRHMTVIYDGQNKTQPQYLTVFADESNCYSGFYSTFDVEPRFFYGGPGLSPRCP